MKNIWDILSWVALGYILLWLILKVTGVINTPVIVEYSPLFGVVYIIGRAMNKLDFVVKEFYDFKKDTKDNFAIINNKMSSFDDKLNKIDNRVCLVEHDLRKASKI